MVTQSKLEPLGLDDGRCFLQTLLQAAQLHLGTGHNKQTSSTTNIHYHLLLALTLLNILFHSLYDLRVMKLDSQRKRQWRLFPFRNSTGCWKGKPNVYFFLTHIRKGIWPAKLCTIRGQLTNPALSRKRLLKKMHVHLCCCLLHLRDISHCKKINCSHQMEREAQLISYFPPLRFNSHFFRWTVLAGTMMVTSWMMEVVVTTTAIRHAKSSQIFTTNKPTLSSSQAECPSSHLTNGVKALKRLAIPEIRNSFAL